MSQVTMIGGDKATKALSEFMMHSRTEAPENAESAGRPGEWAVDSKKLYLCLAPNDWYAIALVPVSSDTSASRKKKS